MARKPKVIEAEYPDVLYVVRVEDEGGYFHVAYDNVDDVHPSDPVVGVYEFVRQGTVVRTVEVK